MRVLVVAMDIAGCVYSAVYLGLICDISCCVCSYVHVHVCVVLSSLGQQWSQDTELF